MNKSQFSAVNRGNSDALNGRPEGFLNRRPRVRISPGAPPKSPETRDFRGFARSPITRETREKHRFVSAQWAAQYVPESFSPTRLSGRVA